METVLLWIRGLASLGLVVGLTFYTVAALRLLVREPSANEFRFFRLLAWLAIVQAGMDLIISRGNWLHLTYGLLIAALLHFVGGLERGGWFYKALAKPPTKVGAYLLWASFVALLLDLRFIVTR